MLAQLTDDSNFKDANETLHSLIQDKEVAIALTTISSLRIRNKDLEQKAIIPLLKREARRQNQEAVCQDAMRLLVRLSPEDGFAAIDEGIGTEIEPICLAALQESSMPNQFGLLNFLAAQPRPNGKLIAKWRKILESDPSFATRVTVAKMLLALQDEESAEKAVYLLLDLNRLQNGAFQNDFFVFNSAGEKIKKHVLKGFNHKDARVRTAVTTICAQAMWYDQVDALKKFQEDEKGHPALIHAATEAQISIHRRILDGINDPDPQAALEWGAAAKKYDSKVRLGRLEDFIIRKLRKAEDAQEQEQWLNTVQQVNPERWFAEVDGLIGKEKDRFRRQELMQRLINFSIMQQP